MASKAETPVDPATKAPVGLDTEVVKMYDLSSELDKAIETGPEEIAKKESVYKQILEFKTTSNKTKALIGQFTPRYFKYYPNLAPLAMDTLMDLCEDEETHIRILSIKAYPVICNDNRALTPKVADILAQLLQSDGTLVLDAVKYALLALLKLDVNGVTTALFTFIAGNISDTQRDKVFLFIKEKISSLLEDLYLKNEDAQRNLAENCKKVFSDVSGDEFKTLFGLLVRLPIYKRGSAQDLVDVLVGQAEITAPFKADQESILRLTSCLQMGSPYFKRADASPFFNYLVSSVFSKLSELSDDQALEILHFAADLSIGATKEEAEEHLPVIWKLLESKLPGGATEGDAVKINYNQLESLLFLFVAMLSRVDSATIRSLVGYVDESQFTGQPSDKYATEEEKKKYQDFMKRIELTSKMTKELADKVRKALGNSKETEKVAVLSSVQACSKGVFDLCTLLLGKKASFKQISIVGHKASWQSSRVENVVIKRKREDSANPSKESKNEEGKSATSGVKGRGRNNFNIIQGILKKNADTEMENADKPRKPEGNHGYRGGRGGRGRGRGRGGYRS